MELVDLNRARPVAAVLPVLPTARGLLGRIIVTEQVFGLNGLGRMVVRAVTNQDEPVLIAIGLLASVFVVVVNILVDILYAVLDPRVRPA